MQKQCTKCKETKNVIDFHKNKSRKDGYNSFCKNCANENSKAHYYKNIESKKTWQKEYRLKNIDKINKRRSSLEYKKQKKKWDSSYALKNRELILKKAKKYYENNKEKVKKYKDEYYSKNKEELNKISRENNLKNRDIRNAQKREYYQNNKEKLYIASKKYRSTERAKELIKLAHKRERSTVEGRLRHSLSSRLRHAIKGKYKNSSTLEYLGCTVGELKTHLEKQFTTEMNWSNYGSWHIDHIKPCVSFDLTKEREIKKCFNFANIQPLTAFENLSKGSRIL